MKTRLFSVRPKGLLLLPLVSVLAACGGDDGGGGGSDEPRLVGPADVSPLAAKLNSEILRILPEKPGKNWIFDGYVNQRAGDVAWSKSWTRQIDFTGVAWDTTRTLTLITPRHVLMAKHYTRNRGDFVRFHEPNGKQVMRILAGVVKLNAGYDVAVGVLNEPVPSTIRHYKLLAPAENLHAQLEGALALATDGERMVHVFECAKPQHFGLMSFRFPSSLPKKFYEPLVKGDSGNPTFLLVRGEPVLLETHFVGGTGAGPFYGNAQIQAAISGAIVQLAAQHGGGEYSIETIKP